MITPNLPGAELIERGLKDLDQGATTVESLLVSIGAPRLRAVGVHVATAVPNAELQLYGELARQYGDAAHARYNSLVRLLVSFQRAAAACAR